MLPVSDSFVTSRISPTRVVWQASETSLPGGCEFVLQGDSGGLILDFGRELCGGVEILVGDVIGPAGSTLSIRFGESVSEVAGRLSFCEESREIRSNSQIQLGETGFRFVRLELLEAGASVGLRKVRAVSTQRDLEYRGSFRCDDERLNKIWSVGAATVHLCMQAALWDGIKRGRRVWAGDLFPASMVVSTVFGEQPIVPASLDEVRDTTLDGWIEEPSWMNRIPAYSLWWILAQERWYLYHGNHKYLEQQRTYLARLLSKLERSVDRAGCERLDGWRFLDWATEGEGDIHAGFQSLFVLGLEAAIALCGWLGDTGMSGRCRACLSKLKQCVPEPTRNKQASALMALAGFGDPVRINHEVLAVDPLAELTPFLAYPVLEARAGRRPRRLFGIDPQLLGRDARSGGDNLLGRLRPILAREHGAHRRNCVRRPTPASPRIRAPFERRGDEPVPRLVVRGDCLVERARAGDSANSTRLSSD